MGRAPRSLFRTANLRFREQRWGLLSSIEGSPLEVSLSGGQALPGLAAGLPSGVCGYWTMPLRLRAYWPVSGSVLESTFSVSSLRWHQYVARLEHPMPQPSAYTDIRAGASFRKLWTFEQDLAKFIQRAADWLEEYAAKRSLSVETKVVVEEPARDKFALNLVELHIQIGVAPDRLTIAALDEPVSTPHFFGEHVPTIVAEFGQLVWGSSWKRFGIEYTNALPVATGKCADLIRQLHGNTATFESAHADFANPFEYMSVLRSRCPHDENVDLRVRVVRSDETGDKLKVTVDSQIDYHDQANIDDYISSAEERFRAQFEAVQGIAAGYVAESNATQ